MNNEIDYKSQFKVDYEDDQPNIEKLRVKGGSVLQRNHDVDDYAERWDLFIGTNGDKFNGGSRRITVYNGGVVPDNLVNTLVDMVLYGYEKELQ